MTGFFRSELQWCVVHRMRNLACKYPEELWSKFKVQAQANRQASSETITKDLADGLGAEFGRSLSSAVASFRDDFEAYIAHLRMPGNHRCAIQAINFLERLFVKGCRRQKIIPNGWVRRAAPELMIGAMIRASGRWWSVRVRHFRTLSMVTVRKEHDE